jgi:Periplasmic copper-binding protein (NosD)
MRINRTSRFTCAVIIAIALQTAVALAAVVQVGGNCKGALVRFNTITDAVNAVPTGSTVYICPGTYPEQVSIVAKQVSLVGVQTATGTPTITSPAGGLVANAASLSSGNPIAAQILVQSSPGLANISNLAVDGSGNNVTACLPIIIGIYYQNSSGTVSHVATRNQLQDPSDQGCQSGLGIFVQSGNSGTSTVTVSASSVHSYQKNGITGNEAGTTINVIGNTVVGLGPTSGAAENGIQIGFGAAGKIQNNTTLDDIWAPDNISDPGDAAAGILVYASSNVTTTGNTVGNTQFGIAYVTDLNFGAADVGTITSNKVSATHIFDAIDVCSNSNIVKSNTINSADESGIHLDSSCSGSGNFNTVTNNIIQESCAGLLLGTGTGSNGITPNTYLNVGGTTVVGDTCQSNVAESPTRKLVRRIPSPTRP